MENVENQEFEAVVELAEEVATEVSNAKEVAEEILDRVEESQKELAEQLEEQKRDLFVRECNLALKENGLEAFADVINVSDKEQLTDVIKQLTAIVNGIKTDAGYIPKDNLSQNAYDTAKASGDTKSMIKSLFSRK